jgi:hypothetical protein
METSSFNAPKQFVQDGEVGPIPRAEVSTLGVYLGMSDLADTSAPPPDAGSDAGDAVIDQLLALGVGGDGSGGGAGGSGGGGLGARRESAASSLDEGAGVAGGQVRAPRQLVWRPQTELPPALCAPLAPLGPGPTLSLTPPHAQEELFGFGAGGKGGGDFSDDEDGAAPRRIQIRIKSEAELAAVSPREWREAAAGGSCERARARASSAAARGPHGADLP